MSLDRRSMIRGSGLCALLAALPAGLRAEATPGYAAAHAAKAEALLTYFSGRGYRKVAPLPLLTGDETFNAGLVYDPLGLLTGGGTMVLQPCARVSDVAAATRGDVLPVFHILATGWQPGATVADVARESLAFLTGQGIDAARLGFVSTPALEPLRPVLEGAGIDWGRQVHLRDAAEAEAAADGAGFLSSPNLPRGFPTAAVHVDIEPAASAASPSYPVPERWTEIGEFGLEPGVGTAHAFGVQRLVLATDGLLPSWADQFEQLLVAVGPDADPALRETIRMAFER